MPEKDMPTGNNEIQPDLLNGLKAFGAIAAQSGQRDVSIVLGALANAIEQKGLEDFALNVSLYAIRNGLDKPVDFTGLKGVKI